MSRFNGDEDMNNKHEELKEEWVDTQFPQEASKILKYPIVVNKIMQLLVKHEEEQAERYCSMCHALVHHPLPDAIDTIRKNMEEI